ncbi:CSLREA domain-containing protein, partial [Acinetobacter baumannii]
MLKQGLGIGLLCIAGHAYCDSIIVNTTADEVKDDHLCSLREAVEYI